MVTPNATAFESAPASWELWWYLNRDRYLRRFLDNPSVGFTDDLEASEASASVSHKNRPTDHSQTMTALIGAVHGQHFAVAPAGLEALARNSAKVPADYWQQQLHDRTLISSQAVLSLGMSRTPQAFEQLFHILQDTSAGRKLLDEATISTYMRQQAAYALGAFAAQRERGMLNSMIAERMTDYLVLEADLPSELQRAIATALPMTRPRDANALAEKLNRLLGEDSRPMELRVALPVVMAKLLENTTPEHPVKQEALLQCFHLFQNKRTDSVLRLSAIQAIGLITDAEGTHGLDIISGLKKLIDKDRNQNLRNHALMALAYIGGRVGPTAPVVEKEILPYLLQTVRKGRKEAGAWAALSLGVMSARGRELGHSQFASPIGMAVLDAFQHEKSPSNRSAYAIALALMEFRTASEPLHTLLHETHITELQAHLCTALGMLGETSCRNDFLNLITGGNAPSTLVRASSEALAMLGGTGSINHLIPVLRGESGGGMPAQVAAAYALRNFPDEKSQLALTEVLLNPDTNPWVAREACATLGLFGSDVQEMLRSRFASDLNTWSLPADLIGPEGILERL